MLSYTLLSAQIQLVDSKGTLRDTSIILAGRVKYTDTAAMLIPYLKKLDTIKISPFYLSGGTSDAGNDKSTAIYRNGNLGIGVSSPITTLHVNHSLAATNTINADANVLRLSRASSSGIKYDNIAQFNIGAYSAESTNASTRLDLAMNDGAGTTTSNIMTWQANGNIGIGTTSPTGGLQLYGSTSSSLPNIESFGNTKELIFSKGGATTGLAAISGFDANSYKGGLAFWVKNTGGADNWGSSTILNAMTIRETGRVGLGTNAPGYPVHISTTDNASLYVESTSADNNGMLILNANTASNWASNWHEFLMFKNQNTTIGSVINNGTSAVSYSTTSDERLKENIRPTSFSINDLLKIQIKDFTYKSDKGTNYQTGVLAQQLFKVIPSVVIVGGNDPLQRPWQVDYSKLTPFLIKAVQDQQHQIEVFNEQSKKLSATLNDVNLLNQQLLEIVNKLEKRIQSLEKK